MGTYDIVHMYVRTNVCMLKYIYALIFFFTDDQRSKKLGMIFMSVQHHIPLSL